MYPYRVFISYSQEDRERVRRIADWFHRLGAHAVWDEDLQPGVGFHDEIAAKIAHAHFFAPILTPSASKRPWVHQEIGYALALDIPVLPIQMGNLPEGMAEQLHALRIDPELSDLETRLTAKVLEALMSRPRARSRALYFCAYRPEERTRMIVEAAGTAKWIGRGPSKIRIKAALTPFSLPDAPPEEPIWDDRDGKNPRSKEAREWARQERAILEEHARGAGCDLLIYPNVGQARGKRAHATGLRTLIDFLRGMPDERTRVAVRDGNPEGELHLIGDWYLIESLAPRPGFGFMQTMFTRHTPTILQRIAEFDSELEYALGKSRKGEGSSRVRAVKHLQKLIKTLDAAAE